MSSLRELQQRFAEAVFAGPSGVAPSFVAGAPAFADDRIGIYRDTIFANYRKALSATYPVVKRLVGGEFLRVAVDAFVRAHPSTCGDLNIYGDSFGDFLAAYPPAAELPYLADVARLEWAIDEAHRAPDSPRVPESVLAALSIAPPARLPALRLRLDASCRLLTSPFPILRIWQTNQAGYAGDDHVSLGDGGDALLVRRDPHGISLERVSAGDHAWLAALGEGETLGAAIDRAQTADLTFDLGAALRAHIAAGTIVAAHDD
jgi:hypothetical protein